PRLLITSSMKSEPGRSMIRAAAARRGGSVSAASCVVDGVEGVARGGPGCCGSAAATGAPFATSAAALTAAPFRNPRRPSGLPFALAMVQPSSPGDSARKSLLPFPRTVDSVNERMWLQFADRLRRRADGPTSGRRLHAAAVPACRHRTDGCRAYAGSSAPDTVRLHALTEPRPGHPVLRRLPQPEREEERAGSCTEADARRRRRRPRRGSPRDLGSRPAKAARRHDAARGVTPPGQGRLRAIHLDRRERARSDRPALHAAARTAPAESN